MSCPGDNYVVPGANPCAGGGGGGSGVQSVVAGNAIAVDNTDPLNPIVGIPKIIRNISEGANVTVDYSVDPEDPIISASGVVESISAGTGITVAGTAQVPIVSLEPLGIAQYYKNAPQNTTVGNTIVTFNGLQLWNNSAGYIQFLNSNINFEVLKRGIYQLEFCLAIFANSAVWANASTKQAGITITRGSNQVVLANTIYVPSTFSHNIQVVGTVELLIGDIINCVYTATSLSSGTPTILGLLNTFDYNTTFTWTFIKET